MEEDSTREKRSSFSFDQSKKVDGVYANTGKRVSNYTCGKRRRLTHENAITVGCDQAQVVKEKLNISGKVGCNDRGNPVMGLTLITASRLKEFRKTVSALSIQKLVAINELGFGPLNRIGNCNFNRELCQMLVESFDVESCTLKIHGRDLCISDWDFYRLMGVRNGGTEVLLDGSIEDPAMNQLMRSLCNDKNEITTNGLKEIVEHGMEPDDTFKVAFALYALAMILCPMAPERADPKLLIPLCNPGSICNKNWATFCFWKLLEGVSLYQKKRTELLTGCLLLLQLFYFDSVCYGTSIVPMSLKPIVGWTRKRAEMLIKWIMSQGGFSSTCIFVMKRNHATCGGTKLCSAAIMGSDCYVCDAISLVKTEVSEVQGDIGMLTSNMVRLEPNLDTTGNIFREIAISVHEMNQQSIKSIVEDVMKCITGLVPAKHYMDGFKEMWMKEVPVKHEIRVENGISPEIRKSSPDIPVESKSLPQQADFLEPLQVKVGRTEDPMGADQTYEDNVGRKYDPMSEIQPQCKTAMRKFSRRESKILKYLFTHARGAASDNSKEDVACCGNSSVTAIEIQSLLPKMNLSGKVINIAAAYMFEKDSTSWFFPTDFGESAISFNGNVRIGVSIPLVILRSGLQRFHRLLKRCEKIFIPLHDEVAGQWFLLVVNLGEEMGEIWDSAYDGVANTLRVEIARTTMFLLHKVFGNEMTSWRDVYYDFRRFKLTYPTTFPTNENNHDSGIYVVRHMQYYSSNWFEGVNAEDQRRLIALEIVMNPKNEALNIVKKAALGQKRQNTAQLETSNDQHIIRSDADTEFVDVITDDIVNAPNGRKCRSHRKRSSRT